MPTAKKPVGKVTAKGPARKAAEKKPAPRATRRLSASVASTCTVMGYVFRRGWEPVTTVHQVIFVDGGNTTVIPTNASGQYTAALNLNIVYHVYIGSTSSPACPCAYRTTEVVAVGAHFRKECNPNCP